MAWVTAMAAGGEQTRSAHARDVSLGARIGTLTKVFCIFGPNLVILAWTGPELSRGQACDWHTDRQTDTQTQATTIPEGQKWPRVKIKRPEWWTDNGRRSFLNQPCKICWQGKKVTLQVCNTANWYCCRRLCNLRSLQQQKTFMHCNNRMLPTAHSQRNHT